MRLKAGNDKFDVKIKENSQQTTYYRMTPTQQTNIVLFSCMFLLGSHVLSHIMSMGSECKTNTLYK